MSRWKIVYLFVAILLILSLNAHAYSQRDNDPMIPGSSYEVTGQIRAADNKTVENVMVRLETASGALVDQGGTDASGRFRFTRLRSGQYRVSAKAFGLIAAPQTVDISRASPRMYVMLQLMPETATFRSREPAHTEVLDARIPGKAASELAKAQTVFENGKLDEAIIHLEKALSIYPRFYEAQFLLGKIYVEKNQWPRAAEAFNDALKTHPKSIRTMVLLGEAYRRQKKYEEARTALENAIKFDENSWDANYTLGRVYWETSNLAKAGFYIARTIELQPSIAEAHLLAGNIFIRAGLPDNALIEYEEYLRLSPTGEFSAQTRELVTKLKKSQRMK